MHAIDLRDRTGRIVRLALRRYVDADRLATDPWYLPEREIQALQIAADAGVPAPRVIAVDVEPQRCDVPALLETRIAGRPIRRRPADLERYLRQAADQLLAIHAVDHPLVSGLPPYAPYQPPSRLRIPPWSTRRYLWIRALSILAGPVPEAVAGFIHRDFHHGNVLVSRGRIAGVVDWLTACRGPRSIDLARTRLNLAADFGLEPAARFLAIYRERAPTEWEHDPYWDLLDGVDMAQDERPPRTRREVQAWDRFERWVGSAVEACGRSSSP
jgi:aminoglycoside phosphotransferase (APT) family kinase protein